MYTFIETRLFSRLVTEYLSDDEYSHLQFALVNNPPLGVVIKGTGGVRKVRRAARGRGKSGGYRIIYLVRRPKGVIWMLTMYPKNVADSISAPVLRQIRESLDDEQND